MPIWSAAFTRPVHRGGSPTTPILLQTGSVAEFVRQGGIFGDVVPSPFRSSATSSASATRC
jgi:hypothetical protein